MKKYKSGLAYLNFKPSQLAYPSPVGSGIKSFVVKKLVNHYEHTALTATASRNKVQIMATWPKQFVVGQLAVTITAAELISDGKLPKGWAFAMFPYERYIVQKVWIKAHFRNLSSDRIRVWYYNAPDGSNDLEYDNRLDTWEEAAENRKVKKFILYPTSPDNRGDNHYLKYSMTPKHMAGLSFLGSTPADPDLLGKSAAQTMAELHGRSDGNTLLGLNHHVTGPCTRFRYQKDDGTNITDGTVKVTFDVITQIMFYHPKATFDPA